MDIHPKLPKERRRAFRSQVRSGDWSRVEGDADGQMRMFYFYSADSVFIMSMQNADPEISI